MTEATQNQTEGAARGKRRTLSGRVVTDTNNPTRA